MDRRPDLQDAKQVDALTTKIQQLDDDVHMGNQPSSPRDEIALDADPVSAAGADKSDEDATASSAMSTLATWLCLSPRPARAAEPPPSPSPPAQRSQEDAPLASRQSRRLEQFYEVSTQTLGRGHYAVVCRGRCRRTGTAVAVKKIKRFLTDEKRLRAEIAVLQRVQRHPNIVELLDVFETAREVQLVLELCTGGELFERLADKGPYSEADCVRHLRDMARAVQYLHTQGIVHRDLKPENILLSTMDDATAVVKVADFGLAKIFTGASMTTKCGTWGYSAPEMISGSGVAFGYDCKVDSWSLGTILYILLSGFHPFDPNGTHSDNEMIECIKACRFDFADEAWSGISSDARDLICHLLVLDPDERYSVEQILSHPWVSGGTDNQHAGPSELPLSPTIHRDLGRYRQQAKEKHRFFDDDDDDDDDTHA
ncbi:hypothetical protein ATCC90586_005395 [Pythium insidiosum]|nr:hypothetical protein ATCC90586_005395 [Pythium insidiosum]